MYIPKRYGESRIESCPFCGKQSTCMSNQGIPVCALHKENELLDLKCMCGDWLDLRTGKFGPFFQCMKCGNINLRKALEINEDKLYDLQQKLKKDEGKSAESSVESIEVKPPKNKKERSRWLKEHESVSKDGRKEIIVTSDEVDFL